MKKILLTVVIVGTLASCTCSKFIMSEEEIKEKGYAISGWNVVQGDSVLGTLSTMEWELYNNKLTREVSFTTKYAMSDADIKNVIMFLHTKYPEYKIEVNRDKDLIIE